MSKFMIRRNREDRIIYGYGLREVENDAHNIWKVEYQTEELCLAAVKQDGEIIRFIKNPTKEMYIEAAMQNWKSLDIIENVKLKKKIRNKARNRILKKIQHNKRVMTRNDYGHYLLESVKNDNQFLQHVEIKLKRCA